MEGVHRKDDLEAGPKGEAGLEDDKTAVTKGRSPRETGLEASVGGGMPPEAGGRNPLYAVNIA